MTDSRTRWTQWIVLAVLPTGNCGQCNSEDAAGLYYPALAFYSYSLPLYMFMVSSFMDTAIALFNWFRMHDRRFEDVCRSVVKAMTGTSQSAGPPPHRLRWPRRRGWSIARRRLRRRLRVLLCLYLLSADSLAAATLARHATYCAERLLTCLASGCAGPSEIASVPGGRTWLDRLDCTSMWQAAAPPLCSRRAGGPCRGLTLFLNVGEAANPGPRGDPGRLNDLFSTARHDPLEREWFDRAVDQQDDYNDLLRGPQGDPFETPPPPSDVHWDHSPVAHMEGAALEAGQP